MKAILPWLPIWESRQIFSQESDFRRNESPEPAFGVGDRMSSAAYLRELAARMLAAAMSVKDQNLLEQLAIRAGEYLDRATELEAATPQIGETQSDDPEKKG
jgi:hypothetical protein